MKSVVDGKWSTGVQEVEGKVMGLEAGARAVELAHVPVG